MAVDNTTYAQQSMKEQIKTAVLNIRLLKGNGFGTCELRIGVCLNRKANLSGNRQIVFFQHIYKQSHRKR